jgi:predicted enzyme related to lactoylglutathione lyase
MFQSFSHIMMFVTDFDRALSWYTEVLGCKVNFSHAPHYASLRHDEAGVNIALHPTEEGSADVGHGPMPYFTVADIDAARTQLADRGVKVGELKSEGGAKFATFWDSEGNALGIQQA